MTSTVGELIHTFNEDEILQTLARLYSGEGEDPDGYRGVIHTLKTMQPMPTNISVHLSMGTPVDGEEPCVHVSGIDDTGIYGIEFMPWAQWLSMPITMNEELKGMSLLEQLAHCLYEMTWPGYTEIEKEIMLNEIHANLEEVETTLSVDEFTKSN